MSRKNFNPYIVDSRCWAYLSKSRKTLKLYIEDDNGVEQHLIQLRTLKRLVKFAERGAKQS